jgi:phosphoglycolate phosphatase
MLFGGLEVMIKLVVFDIDGTLIDSGEAGSKALDRVFWDLFSEKDAFLKIACGGKTDIQIIREGLSLLGLSSDRPTISRILEAYVKTLKSEVALSNKRLMPGVKALLDALMDKGKYRLGLLTGNIREGARIKLEPFSLNRYFPSGAFGDDSENRNDLLPIALRRIRDQEGLSLDFKDCIVVGDTPMDVQCSKPFGALSIAVATGAYTMPALSQTGADHVIEDLSYALNIIEKRP